MKKALAAASAPALAWAEGWAGAVKPRTLIPRSFVVKPMAGQSRANRSDTAPSFGRRRDRSRGWRRIFAGLPGQETPLAAFFAPNRQDVQVIGVLRSRAARL